MLSRVTIQFLILLITFFSIAKAEEPELRTLVEMPVAMQQIFLSKMREHLITLDTIIAAMAENNLHKAADIADNQLGMWHGKRMGKGMGETRLHECNEQEKASDHHDHKHEGHRQHTGKGFGKMMPPAMRAMGRELHQAASQFSTVARNGDVQESLQALQKISSACVACHQIYRVR